MTFRRAAALAVVGALAFGLAGCVGTPAAKPSTSTPAFASDEEAYKAAEEVYREYVDALNKVDLADPKTFEPVFALTTGDANAADRKGMSGYHADGVSIDGQSVIKLLAPAGINSARSRVELASCVDVSSIRLTRADGTSAVDPDRVPVQKLTVTVVETSSSPRAYLIERTAGRDAGPECS